MPYFKIISKLKRYFYHHGMARQWIVFLLTISILFVIYHIFFNPTGFSDGYVRYRKQELELKNNILMMQLDLTRKYVNSLLPANESFTEPDLFITDDFCGSELKLQKCEIIHIAMVCAGFKSSHSVITLLKSILFYRKHPLYFHIMVDDIAKQILETLFDTWDIPHVNVSFYSVADAIPSVQWIPNNHYSGVYGLLKLTLPKILPNNINKIIVLDTDLTFAANIAELWLLFSRFKNNQAIGLVENQSDWYLGKLWKFHKPWPAIGRGFNTGVILLDLKQLNEIKWPQLWRTVAEKTLTVYTATGLADQDIFNAVIKQYPGIAYRLPCQWNVQLSDNTLSEYCYEKSDVKIIHWNSPRKLDVRNKHAEYFKSIYYTFLEFNGNLLRRGLYGCKTMETSTELLDSDLCPDFRKTQINKFRTHIFIREFIYEIPSNAIDVTLVAQLSVDRVQLVEELCKHWDGPMSLTIYATDPEVEQCLEYIENSDILKDRNNIAYHVVYKQGHFYPVNLLRNVGLKYVNTKYVFLSDIDFLPTFGMYTYLKKIIVLFNNDLTKKALLIPAFESQRYRSSFPKNKIELLQMLNAKSLFTFRYHVWAKGHAPTNYTRWRSATASYKVQWAPDFEPYVVVDRTVPEYDTRFVGFGWNKVSHIMELEAIGYEFIVLPQAFIVHMPHAPSQDIARFRASPHYRMCLKMLKEEFINDLRERYGKVFENKNIIN